MGCVLVIDDEPVRTKLFQTMVSQGFPAVGCVAVTSTQGALRLLASQTIDICICPAVMPGLSGLDLIPQALQINPGLAIIILSSFQEHRDLAMERGAFAFSILPFEIDTFIALLSDAWEEVDGRRKDKTEVHEELHHVETATQGSGFYYPATGDLGPMHTPIPHPPIKLWRDESASNTENRDKQEHAKNETVQHAVIMTNKEKMRRVKLSLNIALVLTLPGTVLLPDPYGAYSLSVLLFVIASQTSLKTAETSSKSLSDLRLRAVAWSVLIAGLFAWTKWEALGFDRACAAGVKLFIKVFLGSLTGLSLGFHLQATDKKADRPL